MTDKTLLGFNVSAALMVSPGTFRLEPAPDPWEEVLVSGHGIEFRGKMTRAEFAAMFPQHKARGSKP